MSPLHISEHINVYYSQSDECDATELTHMTSEQIVAGQEKPHMCIWPLNMYLLQNIQELSEISFIHVPGTQLY